MSEGKKYVPAPEGLHLELHRRAVATGLLHLQKCSDCGAFRHPPRYYCPQCFSPAWDMVASAGTGTVYTFTVTHRSFDPGWAAETPHVTVAVELDEGPRVIAALQGADPASVRLGQPVRVVVDPRGDDFAFLWAELEERPAT